MYGPAGMQVAAGHWEHDALRAAQDSRRYKNDHDFGAELERQHERAQQYRIVGIVAAVMVALVVIVLV